MQTPDDMAPQWVCYVEVLPPKVGPQRVQVEKSESSRAGLATSPVGDWWHSIATLCTSLHHCEHLAYLLAIYQFVPPGAELGCLGCKSCMLCCCHRGGRGPHADHPLPYTILIPPSPSFISWVLPPPSSLQSSLTPSALKALDLHLPFSTP